MGRARPIQGARPRPRAWGAGQSFCLSFLKVENRCGEVESGWLLEPYQIFQMFFYHFSLFSLLSSPLIIPSNWARKQRLSLQDQDGMLASLADQLGSRPSNTQGPLVVPRVLCCIPETSLHDSAIHSQRTWNPIPAGLGLVWPGLPPLFILPSSNRYACCSFDGRFPFFAEPSFYIYEC